MFRILLIAAIALVYQALHLGLTIDEPSHFAAAQMYWLGDDVLHPVDTRPLTRMISGWVPLVLGTTRPPQTKAWPSNDAYDIGNEILQQPGTQFTVFCTRLPFLAFPLLTIWLAWHWGRQLFGERIGVVLAACIALEPRILGHGALIKSDVAAALGALWVAYETWQHWQTPTVHRLIRLTLALVFAALVKYSLLPFVAIGYVVALIKGPRRIAAWFIPAALYVAILMGSTFDVQPLRLTDFEPSLASALPQNGAQFFDFVGRLPWPKQYVAGLLFVMASAKGAGFPAYFLGHSISGVVPLYYPLAWAIKVPIPLQILTVAGLVATLVRLRFRRAEFADFVIWAPSVLFFLLATFSSYHIGFRHVLPILPLFLMGGGFALHRWSEETQRLVPVLLGWLVVSACLFYPHGISYFNEWVGGPKNGWKYLADSNIDWGQNLPELGAYIKRHRIESMHTFIMSSDYAWRCLRPGTIIPQPWPSDEPGAPRRYQPKPGYYAISVNVLTGFLFGKAHEDYLDYFLHAPIIGRAGYSILMYRVDPAKGQR